MCIRDRTSIKKVHNKLDSHINNNHKKQEELKAEVYHTLKQQQQELGETNNILQQRIEEVNGRQKTTEQKLDENVKEKTTHIKELKCQLERLRRQITEGESGPSRTVNGQVQVELKYDGTDRFPMEFLKELSEFQELYYSNSDIKWIGKHLEKDASCLLYTSRCV